MPRYYSPLQAAAILGLSKNTMYKYLKNGTIRSIRLGEGRIKVPGSEINKFVAVSDNVPEEINDANESFQSVVQPQDPVMVSAEEISESLQLSEPAVVSIPDVMNDTPPEVTDARNSMDIYDWMVGLGAVMLAMAFFLFPKTGGNVGTIASNIFWWLRIGVFVWGFGHILFSLLLTKEYYWKRVSYFMGGIFFGGFVGMMLIAGDLGGATIYLSMAFGLFVSATIEMTPVKRYVVHIVAAILAINLFYFLIPGDFWRIWSQTSNQGSDIKGATTSAAVLFAVFGSGVVIFHSMQRKIFITANYLMTAVMVYVLYVAVLSGMWDKVFILLVWTAFGMIFPFANKLRWDGGQNRFAAAQFIGGIGMMILVVTTIGSLMTNMRTTYVDNFSESVVEETKLSIDREMIKAQDRLRAVASSKLIRDAVVNNDAVTQQEYLRDMIRGSSAYMQMLVLDLDGNVTAYYPRTSPDLVGNNFAFRDYFFQARAGKSFVSSMLFQANISGAPWAAAVSVPVLDDEGRVIAVIAGRLNLDIFDQILTSYSQAQGTMYLLDTSGRVISAKNSSLGQAMTPIGEKANLAVLGGDVVPNIASVTTQEFGAKPVPQIANTQTNCCGWYVALENVNNSQVNNFELVGLSLVMGMMIMIALGVAVMAGMNRQNFKKIAKDAINDHV